MDPSRAVPAPLASTHFFSSEFLGTMSSRRHPAAPAGAVFVFAFALHVAVLCAAAAAAAASACGPSSNNARCTRIAFGSCSKVDQPQPLWETIASTRPDAFVWGGDNVRAVCYM